MEWSPLFELLIKNFHFFSSAFANISNKKKDLTTQKPAIIVRRNTKQQSIIKRIFELQGQQDY